MWVMLTVHKVAARNRPNLLYFPLCSPHLSHGNNDIIDDGPIICWFESIPNTRGSGRHLQTKVIPVTKLSSFHHFIQVPGPHIMAYLVSISEGGTQESILKESWWMDDKGAHIWISRHVRHAVWSCTALSGFVQIMYGRLSKWLLEQDTRGERMSW